jgi:hypothetical protein
VNAHQEIKKGVRVLPLEARAERCIALFTNIGGGKEEVKVEIEGDIVPAQREAREQLLVWEEELAHLLRLNGDHVTAWEGALDMVPGDVCDDGDHPFVKGVPQGEETGDDVYSFGCVERRDRKKRCGRVNGIGERDGGLAGLPEMKPRKAPANGTSHRFQHQILTAPKF